MRILIVKSNKNLTSGSAFSFIFYLNLCIELIKTLY